MSDELISLRPGQTSRALPRRGWSEMRDSNSRPSAPKADALPGCANLRNMVEPTGIEPATFCLQSRRSPN